MRKQQYIATVACLVAGVIGFVSVYATDKGKERREAEQEIAAQTQQEAPASYEVKPETSVEDATKKAEEQALKLAEQEKMEQEETQQEQGKKQDEEKTAETAAAVTLHFDKSSAVWPIEGDVLLDYSMDSTIYFPTLEQYRCNPAMVIGGKVNDKVFAMAKGKITDIQENEETGCTVIQDLGDGYAAVYGQLKELNFAKGDTPEAGQVLGYVSEPTKYYTTEGSNVYFQLKRWKSCGSERISSADGDGYAGLTFIVFSNTIKCKRFWSFMRKTVHNQEVSQLKRDKIWNLTSTIQPYNSGFIQFWKIGKPMRTWCWNAVGIS